MRGTYVLVLALERPTTLEVGSLGSLAFDAGTYAYVGSAFGPGGFARVDRHAELARGERETRHWHVDYLLGCPDASLENPVFFPDERRECELARSIPGDQVRGFGSSDCECAGHLIDAPPDRDVLEALLESGGCLEAPSSESDAS
ncbi:GIY-YIG nuclease family protein [Halostagnicola kamekurae]|uniref:Uri superfamily endonuclease n=1 Tax=Halostagnicola kamekurae TaxID=619731 RepID=A0A1I6Q3P3_9EURY|nr:GIY-YIG nuclease family protein [Halostagnicola kamekurae]SFS46968.1 Uri superfamily endonuclease [Halostagnicola kamekurae]